MAQSDVSKTGSNFVGQSVSDEESLPLSNESVISGSCFNSSLYTVKVGPSSHVFKVHKDILCWSRVLACMCNGPFAESTDEEIVLPEDDPDSFGRALVALYGNPSRAFSDIKHLPMGSEQKLVDMYALADKYELCSVKEEVVNCLKQSAELATGSPSNALLFFNITSKILNYMLDSDELFLHYFEEEAPQHLRVLIPQPQTSAMKEFAELLENGGPFAKRICLMMAQVYREEADKNREELIKKQAAVSKKEADLDKARRMHRSQHPNCGQCHVLLTWNDEFKF